MLPVPKSKLFLYSRSLVEEAASPIGSMSAEYFFTKLRDTKKEIFAMYTTKFQGELYKPKKGIFIVPLQSVTCVLAECATNSCD